MIRQWVGKLDTPGPTTGEDVKYHIRSGLGGDLGGDVADLISKLLNKIAAFAANLELQRRLGRNGIKGGAGLHGVQPIEKGIAQLLGLLLALDGGCCDEN